MASPADLFEPDLIVTTDDSTELVLVVEAKLHPVALVETERQLKLLLLAMRCPVGLLATPKKIRLYYDQYLSATEDSVKLVGEYAAPLDWAAWQQGPGSAQVGAGFEDAVRNWLA